MNLGLLWPKKNWGTVQLNWATCLKNKINNSPIFSLASQKISQFY